MLDTITSGVEEILSTGGFSLKPWVRSGQGGRRKDDASTCGGERPEATPKTLVLPNQLKDEANKALGIGYLVDSDQLYVMTSVNFSKRKRRMRTGLNLKIEEVWENTPKGLSRRELLSQVAALYDPIGLVSPAKQKGNILVRRAFQEAGGGSSAKETWDDPISPGLREEAIKLFGEYVRLGEIKFHRSLTPSGQRGRPWGITFSDGSDHAYGAVLYVRWETQQGIEVRLVESKAKLAPLDQKGDAVRAEVCGTVYATRLRKYVERHGRLQIEHWIHLVDSRTVLGAIQRESYGYQSFFANRIGEIQKAGSPTEWWWIPGECNVADIITRGAAPEELSEDSPWQKGPGFLEKPFEEWPVKSAAEVAADARESVNKLKRKAFSGALTRAQASVRTGKVKVNQSLTEPACDSGIPEESQLPEEKSRKRPCCASITDLVNPERFSSLSRLCQVVAWVWHAAQKWLEKRSCSTSRAGKQVKRLDKQSGETVLSPKEREGALQDLFLAAQKDMSLPTTTINRLVVYKEEESGLLRCKGRVPVWDSVEASVPVLPHGSLISTLLAREAHERSHEGIAGTLLQMSGCFKVGGSRRKL
ncbi:hypothetical protein AAFF_G00315790 [Aldrovandia affinis]|uniref:Uncharacterized protein n=1 Tax=Aldrovandia affinis TaxID=143900 RepID=A0AAD7WRE6_9TELE|nr:hypothetical protein AAFF_G00315790 [Aldrovandia affinis]